MPKRDIIVVGTSAGGVEALQRLAARLPEDLPAPVLVVLHLAPFSSSKLPDIVSRAGRFPAAHAIDGERLSPGRILVAPPDHHLVVERDHVRVTRGPPENGHRPAIDVLLRSAARSHGPRAVAVVLTGTLDDGAAGLVAIRRHGGVAVVQDPADAAFPDLPANALRAAGADHVVTLGALPPLLARLVTEDAPEPVPQPEPEPAGGARMEEALWSALRALEERGALSRKLEARARHLGQRHTTARFGAQAVEAEERSRVLRTALSGEEPEPEQEDVPDRPPGSR